MNTIFAAVALYCCIMLTLCLVTILVKRRDPIMRMVCADAASHWSVLLVIAGALAVLV
jgi:hypothetical protein